MSCNTNTCKAQYSAIKSWMHKDGRCISSSSLHCISTSSTEEWKKLCCSLLPFFRLADYHDNSKFLFNPLTYVLRGWGFSPAAEKGIGWGRVIERLHGRAAIGSWNLLIRLHQSLPVRWLWHSAKSMLSILSWQSPRPNMSQKNFNASFLSPSRGKQNKDKINFIFFCSCLVYWKRDNHFGLSSGFEPFEAVLFFNVWPHFCRSLAIIVPLWSAQDLLRHELQVCAINVARKCLLLMFPLSNPTLSPFLSIYK